MARRRPVVLALALAAPLAGFTALHFEYSAAAALVHAAAAALLFVSAAYTLAASLDPYQGNARGGRHSAGDE
jgi:heme A synthase